MAEVKAFLAVNSNRPEISKTVVPDTDRWVIVILLSSYWGFFFVNEEFLMSRRKRWVRDPSKSVQTKRFKNFGQSYLLVCIGFFSLVLNGFPFLIFQTMWGRKLQIILEEGGKIVRRVQPLSTTPGEESLGEPRDSSRLGKSFHFPAVLWTFMGRVS